MIYSVIVFSGNMWENQYNWNIFGGRQRMSGGICQEILWIVSCSATMRSSIFECVERLETGWLLGRDRESRLDFMRIGVITAFLKTVGTQPVDSEVHIIGSSMMAILEVTCFDKTSGSGSREEHVLVSLRREISVRDGVWSCSRETPGLRLLMGWVRGVAGVANVVRILASLIRIYPWPPW